MNDDLKKLFSFSPNNEIPYSVQLKNDIVKMNTEERRHQENLAETRKANEISNKALKIASESNKRSKRTSKWTILSSIGTIGAFILSLIALIKSCTG